MEYFQNSKFMQKKIHDEQSSKLLSKDRISPYTRMTHRICLDSNLGLLDQSAGKDLGKLDLLCISEVEIQNQIFLEYKKEVINLASVQPLICLVSLFHGYVLLVQG